jgi:glutamate synthase (NADPH/NADH) small chain
VNEPQAYPETRPASLRREDFNEVYKRFALNAARQQASRCSQCGIPFCQQHCPLGNHIPDWLKLAAEDRLEEAYLLSSSTNSFPEICGRICPQDRLCEGNCVIDKGFGSVTIGAVENFITETAWEKGWVKPIKPTKELGFSAAIIGSGPAGLAAAESLRRKGWKVEVHDRHDRAGGLLIYGIPNFKLEKQVVQRRVNWLKESGVTFVTGSEIGKDVALKELRQQHDAVLIATGVYKARQLQVPGLELQPIVPALDYLIASNRLGLGDKVKEAPSAEGRNVVVIGGGDTAMDCVRTAVRQKAASVTCLYRRDRANMPGSAREVKHAEDEGVVFKWLSLPKAFVGEKNRLQKILVGHMRLGPPDGSGRQQAMEVDGSKEHLHADMAINALGFEAEDMPVLFNEPKLACEADGRVRVNEHDETSLPGVFAAGDIVRGASLVVWAIRDGRHVADAMHRHAMRRQQGAAHVA